MLPVLKQAVGPCFAIPNGLESKHEMQTDPQAVRDAIREGTTTGACTPRLATVPRLPTRGTRLTKPEEACLTDRLAAGDELRRDGHRLLQVGALLFLLGPLIGLAVPRLAVPRLAFPVFDGQDSSAREAGAGAKRG